MRRTLIPLIVAIAAAEWTGCARPEGTLFPTVFPAIVWPPPPDSPRVRYVGQLTGEGDLKPAKSGWAVFAESLGGPRSDQSVSTPAGIAVSDDETVYVTDPPLHAVHVFELRTRKYRVLSEAGDQPLFTPAGVAVDGNQVFVTDSTLHAVAVYDANGKFVRTFGVGQLKRPVGIAVARGALPSQGMAPPSGVSGEQSDGPRSATNSYSRSPSPSDRLYVVDAGAHACVVFDTAGIEVARFGQRGSAPGEFNFPTHVAVDPRGDVVIADTLNFRVQRFSSQGQFISSIGTRGDGAGSLALPKGVAVDGAGRVYVVDAQFENVQIFSPEGELLLALGKEGRGPGQFWLPGGAALGPDGRLWIADGYNRRVQVLEVLEKTR